MKFNISLSELEKTLMWAKTRRSHAKGCMYRHPADDGLRRIWIYWDRICRSLAVQLEEKRKEELHDRNEEG